MRARHPITILLATALLFIFTSCSYGGASVISSGGDTAVVSSAGSGSSDDSSATTEPAVAVADPVVRVFAAGDNLIHSPIYQQAKERSAGEGYNFDDAYRHVAKLVSSADLAILNQETPIAGDLFPLSNYPLFNSPTQLGDKMIALGFNVVSHSNNHILDKGEKGMLATLDYWRSRNVLVYGAYRDEDSLNAIPTKEINGITFSFLGFMEHTNGLRLPEDSKARLVYTSETDTMKQLIQEADKLSDVVVVSVHWGVEITSTITEQQRTLAHFFADCGADVVIGTQPHTLQSMEFLQNTDGSQTFIAYSLGNFISAQQNPLAMIGVTVDFNVSKSLSDGKIRVQDVKAIPVITHYGPNYADVTVYPYNEYTQELAAAHGVRAIGSFSKDYIDKIVHDNIPSEFLYSN